jgi:hypothetical protein
LIADLFHEITAVNSVVISLSRADVALAHQYDDRYIESYKSKLDTNQTIIL